MPSDTNIENFIEDEQLDKNHVLDIKHLNSILEDKAEKFMSSNSYGSDDSEDDHKSKKQ